MTWGVLGLRGRNFWFRQDLSRCLASDLLFPRAHPIDAMFWFAKMKLAPSCLRLTSTRMPNKGDPVAVR